MGARLLAVQVAAAEGLCEEELQLCTLSDVLRGQDVASPAQAATGEGAPRPSPSSPSSPPAAFQNAWPRYQCLLLPQSAPFERRISAGAMEVLITLESESVITGTKKNQMLGWTAQNLWNSRSQLLRPQTSMSA